MARHSSLVISRLILSFVMTDYLDWPWHGIEGYRIPRQAHVTAKASTSWWVRTSIGSIYAPRITP